MIVDIKVRRPDQRTANGGTMFVPACFGMYSVEITVEIPGKKKSKPPQRKILYKWILVHSAQSITSQALDYLYDGLFWSWTGKWTEEFEESLALLLVSVDDDLADLIEAIGPLQKMMGIRDFNVLKESATDDLQKALDEQSETS